MPVRRALAVLWALVALAAVNLSIAEKERLLASGTIVYLELAPIDPRSLMQGDYMALNYAVANETRQALQASQPAERAGDLAPGDGRIVVALDQRSVASFRRLDDGLPRASGEMVLRYRVRAGRLKFASNAFFFEEGQGSVYQEARYGEFRVDRDGDLLLTDLRGAELQRLGPPAR
jgi:uncharacterized membrane-anchored protein